MLQNTLILGFFSISAFQDYRNRKINIYFLLTGGIIGLLFHLYSMELSIIEILLGMGIGMMILFFGLWSGGSVGRADGMILVVSGIFLGFEKNVEVFVMGLFLAGITSLFLSVIRRKGRTYRIPFAPFLLAGYLFVKEWEASITIEAAIIMSMAMLLFFVIMKLGLQLYDETRTLAGGIIKDQTVNAVKLFYELERVRELF